MSETETLTAARVPTVYFIDDSATMREVIKIAFRKENIHVITCSDAAAAWLSLTRRHRMPSSPTSSCRIKTVTKSATSSSSTIASVERP